MVRGIEYSICVLQLSDDMILAALYTPMGVGVRPVGVPVGGASMLGPASLASGRLGLARTWLKEGRVLTAACERYPKRLQETLGGEAPAAFWARGLATCGFGMGQRWVAVVGTRTAQTEDLALVRRFVLEAAELGFGIVSGGAMGIDAMARREARRAGVPLLEFLPCGLAMPFGAGPLRGSGWAQLSAWPDLAEFSTLRAMLRNSYIYSSAEAALVVRPRYRQGGSWHGAVNALREKRTRVLVSSPAGCLAGRALCGAGAHRYSGDSTLAEVLAMPAPQPALFSATG